MGFNEGYYRAKGNPEHGRHLHDMFNDPQIAAYRNEPVYEMGFKAGEEAFRNGEPNKFSSKK